MAEDGSSCSSTRRVLVAGGAGFVGSAVVRALTRSGVDVAVLDDLSVGRRSLAAVPDARFFHVSILDRHATEKAVRSFRPEWIIHLAAAHFIPWCNRNPQAAAEINIRGTMHVLDAAHFESVRGVLFASSGAVYPWTSAPIDESTDTDPDDIYGLTKLTGERFCREFHLDTGIPTAVLRLFNVFGPRETNPHLIPEILSQVVAGSREVAIGNRESERDFVHSTDVATVMVALLDKLREGLVTFNVGSGVAHSVAEVIDAFSKALGVDLRVSEDRSKVRRSERPRLLADIAKLRRFADWRPTVSLQAGIAALVEEGRQEARERIL